MKSTTARGAEAEAEARFAPLLSALDVDDLAAVREVVCGMFAGDLMIGYVNAAWYEFARANEAREIWGPGDHLLDAISPPLRAYYADHFRGVARDGTPWEHDYECSSPTVFRQFRLRALPIADGAGVLVTHTLRVERAHTEHAQPAILRRYQVNGLVTQCAHCRRVRRAAAPFAWDWVPELLAHPDPATSHGICALCAAYYFAD